MGLSRLIGQVDAMVRASGQAPADFSAARWFAGWMAQPVAALGGLCPHELLDTADGREALGTLLLQMQSGVYA
ncbi:antitoxin Xre/MbcA/ParS toxin-binding domain-containing protein [Ottowia pentelensis]|uniref:antitoxin Xre/MbcA/ParS toxin-binding domain-containing protein n=1 Tax=Ottowia pentelensis TaxID=511108 RepID=UPI00362BE7CF